MRFRLFGPIEMWDGDRPVDLGHAKQRHVLVSLLMEPDQPVPVRVLIDRVWGHEPPNTALNVLYGYIARLRKALEPTGVRLDRRAGGYLLTGIAPDDVDVHRFRRLLAEAQQTDASLAVANLNEALSLWRGTPFASINSPWITAVREALQGELLSAIIARTNAHLHGGWHAELVSPLLELVTAHPGDDRLVAQLMIALYRSGRACEAIEQYQHARRRLTERFGTEPGPDLQRLLRQVLRGDPVLVSPSGLRWLETRTAENTRIYGRSGA